MESETARKVYRAELLALDCDTRPCEICHTHPHEHAWMLLDVNGIAVDCSRSSIMTRRVCDR